MAMMWLVALVVVALAALAGSPWLLAHRAERRQRLKIAKMRRIRSRVR